MFQLSQRPLTATAADAALFADRSSEVRRIRRAVDLRLNTLVLGGRGFGKTSLLRHVERRLGDDGAEVLFVNGEDSADAESLLHRVVDAAEGRETDNALPPRSVQERLRQVAAVLGERAVVIVDDIDADVAHSVFGRHRDDLWETSLMWIVAGPSAMRTRLLAPPADAFFDVVLELRELPEDAARELLLRRVQVSGLDNATGVALRRAAARIARETTPRTPRALLTAASRVLLDHGEQEMAVDRIPMMQQRAAEIGRPAAMLFTELLDRGPVSASDAELLRVLGWTRPRAVQVLKQLEAADLVTTSTASGGKGRPRTLYGVNPAYEGGEP